MSLNLTQQIEQSTLSLTDPTRSHSLSQPIWAGSAGPTFVDAAIRAAAGQCERDRGLAHTRRRTRLTVRAESVFTSFFGSDSPASATGCSHNAPAPLPSRAANGLKIPRQAPACDWPRLIDAYTADLMPPILACGRG